MDGRKLDKGAEIGETARNPITRTAIESLLCKLESHREPGIAVIRVRHNGGILQLLHAETTDTLVNKTLQAG